MASSRSFASSSISLQNPNLTRQSQPQKPHTTDLQTLQNASRIIQDQLVKDAQIIPDLGETLSASGAPVSASYSPSTDDIHVPYQKRRFIGIPEGLFQYYDTANVTSHMGLMPEIERVWISIDHKLFLWDYVDGQEISSFLDQPDIITHVALVKPKRGLFIDEISSLLVICTPVSVLLLGVSFATVAGQSGRAHKDIKLYATDLSVPTDIEMVSVSGTEEGRIFMCGAQDGNLYELHYQEKESFFAKRVQLINHSVGGVQSFLPRFTGTSAEDRIVSVVSDHDRRCFYTLSHKNAISVYKPTTEKSVQHVQTLSNLYKAAQDKAPGSPALSPQNFQIVSLHVIKPSESRSGLQLLAITTNAVRLYFSPLGSYSYGSTSMGARSLSLVHVRLPPPSLLHPDEHAAPHRPTMSRYGAPPVPPPATRPYIPTTLENSCYVDGLTVAAQPGDTDGTDYILCMAPDLTRIGTLGQLNVPQQPTMQQYPAGGTRPPLTEYATLLAIPGRTWSMAVVPQTHPATNPEGTAVPSVMNELASQFTEPPNQFILLTNVGLTYLTKRRAVDYLRAVLEDLQSEGNVQPIIEFRDSFGRDQTCAMLLGLASGNTYLDTDGSTAGNISVHHDLAAVAKQAFYDFGERPVWTERVTYGTMADTQGTTIYSGRREGLSLYFARLLRPLWKAKLTVSGTPPVQQLAISEHTLENIQKNLYALKDFLDRNPHLFHSSPGDASHRAAGPEQEAWRAEQHSVSELLALLGRTIEALSFTLLLNDYNLSQLIAQCDPVIQQTIAKATFEELITTQTGVTISRALVNVVINQQIGQQISVDTISEVLQQRCGSFCSTDDVMIYKAKENIRKAVETKNPNERQNWLSESLRLFTKGARILEFEKLREICGDYQQLDYAKGAIILPLSCAQVFDSNGTGLEYWRAGCPQSSPGQEAASLRLQCYDLVMDSLTVFEEKCPAKSVSEAKNLMDDPETVRSHAYELAFSSEDEMFHSTLYDWLIERNLADDLLEMRPPYLEAHFKREPHTVQKFQLLWQFYVKNDQPLRAAEVLETLATSIQFDLSLEQRLEYLTLAVANAKSHPVSAGGRHETAIEFLTNLEERLEVAGVQLEIYHTLLPHIGDDPRVAEKVQQLSKRLLTMSELYLEYAVPFDLTTMKLLCIHISEHRDEQTVRPIWTELIQGVIDAGQQEGSSSTADMLQACVVPLGHRFYPSESAFPLRFIAGLLVRFSLARKDEVAQGWAPRLLVQCGVPYGEVWGTFHEMYESQIPPFNDQQNVQSLSSDISILLSDWLEQAKRPQSPVSKDFPAGQIDLAVSQYIAELEPSRIESKARYEEIKRQLRRNW
ncbi:nucleoporin [Pluteus cervinus]|uniref:Nucleoporin n=1 Tax=Pluteus cervinus TaxID=181527 RepID=A0ACD3BG43_9AGAR|nr:nucleoporin [Pluteus cervinus]